MLDSCAYRYRVHVPHSNRAGARCHPRRVLFGVPVVAALVLSPPGVALAQQESAAATMPLGQQPEQQPIEVQVVGSPRWTQSRTFITSRVWLHDPGTQALELWYTGCFGLNGTAGENEHLWQAEYSVGVVKRIQLDVYFNYAKDGDGYHWAGAAIEGRFALPDHDGQIFANPVLYLERKQINGGPARGEARLLLAESSSRGGCTECSTRSWSRTSTGRGQASPWRPTARSGRPLH